MRHINSPVTMTIEFTPEELQALLNVCWRVGGDPKTTPRKHIKSFVELLKENGYHYTATYENLAGGLTFED